MLAYFCSNLFTTAQNCAKMKFGVKIITINHLFKFLGGFETWQFKEEKFPWTVILPLLTYLTRSQK